MKQQVIATRAIVLGRGIAPVEQQGEITWQPSPASEARAAAMAAHYFQNSNAFQRQGSRIVCSGGYAGVAAGQEKPPAGISEGGKIADLLHTAGVPGRLIEVEGESVSTFDNFVQCLHQDFYPISERFTPEDPLLVVGSGPHGKQRGLPIARAAYGIRDSGAAYVLAAERETPQAIAREYIGGVATRVAIAEAHVEPFDPASLAAAGNRFEELAKSPLQLAPAFGQLCLRRG